jgi:hypothetical protein
MIMDKDLDENGYGLIEVLSWRLLRGSEETTKKALLGYEVT